MLSAVPMSAPPDSPLVRHWGLHRRRRRRGLGLPAAAAALVVLAALVWLAVRPHPWRPPSGRPAFASCTLGEGAPARCATVQVPEDPLRPKGPRLALRVAVLPAARRPARGALFYLEGGPGLAATASATTVEDLLGRVGHDRDLVLVDQRGTGGSGALSCPDERVPAEDAAAVAAYVRRCFAQLPPSVRLLTTSVAADDLDAVRRTLGYGRIDLAAGSYGATLAQVYAERYPEAVRSMVLDGASLLDVPLYERSAAGAERALDAVLARCARSASCRRAYPSPRAELASVLARPPRRVTVEAGTVSLGPSEIAWTVDALSRTPGGAASIPYAIDAAARGDYVPLGRAFAANVGSSLDPRARLAMFWVILCSEPWAGFDPAATARAGAGSYLADVAVQRARLFRRACAAVPKGRVAQPRTQATRAPVLLLAGGADPDDPAANLAGRRQAFPHGRLVVVPGAGHGTLGYPCVQRLVARFVARGSATGIDARCARRVPLPPFLIR